MSTQQAGVVGSPLLHRALQSPMTLSAQGVLCAVLCCAVQVGVDLGSSGCIRDIAKATADIKVQIVFCNAGYIMKGFFYAR